MQVPEALDFGFTPVKQNSRNTVKVQNTGDAAVQCRWRISQPFSITPETASIDAVQSVSFEVAFCPLEASVYTVLAACHAETGFAATIKVSAKCHLFCYTSTLLFLLHFHLHGAGTVTG